MKNYTTPTCPRQEQQHFHLAIPPIHRAGNAKVAKVSGAAGSYKVGPAITLKVMAGDKFNVTVNSWWQSASTPGTPISPQVH